MTTITVVFRGGMTASKLDVPFIAVIGAAFDFYAGTRKQSSGFWIRIGLEWLLRLFKEPGRLWKKKFQQD